MTLVTSLGKFRSKTSNLGLKLNMISLDLNMISLGPNMNNLYMIHNAVKLYPNMIHNAILVVKTEDIPNKEIKSIEGEVEEVNTATSDKASVGMIGWGLKSLIQKLSGKFWETSQIVDFTLYFRYKRKFPKDSQGFSVLGTFDLK